ncbi:MAG: FMN-binding protein [Candidatus Lindowbacteria bacterium]|nr:FMN-binding protein [Candidatus Lindowbacteria bacterium]
MNSSFHNSGGFSTAVLRAAVAVSFIFVISSSAHAADKSQFFSRIYMTETEAVRNQLQHPESDRVEADTFLLTAEQVKAVKKRQRVRMFTDVVRYYRIYKKGDTILYRYAVFLQEPGQHEYMDLMYGVNTNGAISRVDLLVYREPYGGEIESRRFMRQFEGKNLGNSKLRVNRDVIHIVGATISSKSAARGARKVLGILKIKGMIQ